MNSNTKPYKYTPEDIKSLQENEIFVFGSNLRGVHNGGAAHYAFKHFGAILGQSEGLQGQSYAIPTTFKYLSQIKPGVDRFIAFASGNPHLTFFVTPIGCGVARFTPQLIAPMFAEAVEVFNIILPKSFLEVLQPQNNNI